MCNLTGTRRAEINCGHKKLDCVAASSLSTGQVTPKIPTLAAIISSPAAVSSDGYKLSYEPVSAQHCLEGAETPYTDEHFDKKFNNPTLQVFLIFVFATHCISNCFCAVANEQSKLFFFVNSMTKFYNS